MTRSLVELQKQIEDLTSLVEAQNRQVEEPYRAVSAAQPAPAVVVAQERTANISNTRILDLIRMIPEFQGNSKNLPSWI